MPGKREAVPASGTGSDPDLTPGFSFEELQAELRQMHEEDRPLRRPGEFTIQEYANTCGLNYESAKFELKSLIERGRVIRINQKRLIDKKMKVVFKMASK